MIRLAVNLYWSCVTRGNKFGGRFGQLEMLGNIGGGRTGQDGRKKIRFLTKNITASDMITFVVQPISTKQVEKVLHLP